jgi:DNA ligase (NAD+)
MNIDGLGAETVDLLVEKGFVNSIPDLYDLTFDQVVKLDRMADKSADNLIKGIEASKAVPFERVLYAIGIRYVGETVAKKLAKHFKSIHAIQQASFEELIQVDEIGEKIAISVQNYFLEEVNCVNIKRLVDTGVQVQLIEKEGSSSTLAGKTFVVSGVFQTFSRDELKDQIELNGGKISSSISSKTNFVVAGENMGPSKLKKATDLGVTILSEGEFIKMTQN